MVKSLGSSQYGAYAGEGSIGGRGRPGSLDSKRAYAECLLEWSELNSKRDAMHSVGEQGVAQCRRDRRTRAGATSRSHKVDGCTSTDAGRSSEEQGEQTRRTAARVEETTRGEGEAEAKRQRLQILERSKDQVLNNVGGETKCSFYTVALITTGCSRVEYRGATTYFEGN